MLRLPRVALGAMQSEAETQPCSWALLDLLSRDGAQIQHFHSQASFSPLNAALTVTGLNSRHLDSWLMSRALCREIFVHGAANSDLAVVEGRFDSQQDELRSSGSRLDVLCDWLDLPRILVLDASRLADCELPDRPAQVDGVILDRLGSLCEVFRLQTCLESLWDVPVLGALEQRCSLQETIAKLPRGANPPRELCRLLGDQLARFARIDRIRALASRREFPCVRPSLFRAAGAEAPPCREYSGRELTSRKSSCRELSLGRPLTVAVAFDSVFNCYFQDTLDLLELHGANVIDFSPLRDEVLPEADIVYLGCGHPELEAEALAANHCMLLALRNHVRGGRRVYAEGGGLAYLCEHLETPRGDLEPMLGLLPAIARLNRQRTPVRPVEVTIARDNWLAPAGTPLRGYLNSNWTLEPTGTLAEPLCEAPHEQDLMGQFQVIGSRIHLNFAAQASVLENFFQPSASKGALVGSRGLV